MQLSDDELEKLCVEAPASVMEVEASAGAEDDDDKDDNEWNDLTNAL